MDYQIQDASGRHWKKIVFEDGSYLHLSKLDGRYWIDYAETKSEDPMVFLRMLKIGMKLIKEDGGNEVFFHIDPTRTEYAKFYIQFGCKIESLILSKEI